MKKVAALLMISVLVLAVAGIALTQLEQDQQMLDKVKKNIILLDRKLDLARQAKDNKKIAVITEERNQAMIQAKILGDRIARQQPKEAGQQAAPGQLRKAGFFLDGGYAGGAGMFKAGYLFTVRENLDLALAAGYGLGNGFSIMDVEVNGKMLFGDNFAGLEAGMANFSKSVKGVPGVSGTVNSGSNTGFGLFVGKKMGKVAVKAGYNTVLGLNAGVIYQF
jgi:hypothetical protein